MTYFDAILLGLIQGITEFIPVSSDGHLALAENFGLVGNVPFFFTVSVHAGTLLATILFFRLTLWEIFTKTIRRDSDTLNLITALVIGTIPAGIVGVLLNNSIDAISSSLVVTGLGFFLSAFWLFGIGKIQHSTKNLTQISLKDALFIGILQVTALLPGASRSGSTIFGGKFKNITSEDAFTFSFLLSMPAILGALLLQVLDAQVTLVPQSIVGALVAATIGYAALHILRGLVIQNRLKPLAMYCLILGIVSLSVGLF